MLTRRASRGDGFRLVPIVLDPDAPKFPFLKSVHHVNFSRPDRYRESFARLLCGLKREPPGPAPWYEGDLETADYSRYAAPVANGVSQPARAWVDQVFEALYSRRAVVMPAPQDRLDGRQTALIRERAEAELGADRFLHAGPPSGSGNRLTKAQRQEYFQILGRQCEFQEPITSGCDFADALAHRLEPGRMLLLVSRFEQGHPDAQVELAKNLRHLLDSQSRLHLILTGGEGLADLYFVTAEHSPAQPRRVPGVPGNDAGRRTGDDCCKRGQDVPLSDAVLDAICTASGGLPRLVERCCRFLSDRGFDRAAAEEGIARSPEIWKKILPLAQAETTRKRLAEQLRTDDVGPAQTVFDRRLAASALLVRSAASQHRPAAFGLTLPRDPRGWPDDFGIAVAFAFGVRATCRRFLFFFLISQTEETAGTEATKGGHRARHTLQSQDAVALRILRRDCAFSEGNGRNEEKNEANKEGGDKSLALHRKDDHAPCPTGSNLLGLSCTRPRRASLGLSNPRHPCCLVQRRSLISKKRSGSTWAPSMPSPSARTGSGWPAGRLTRWFGCGMRPRDKKCGDWMDMAATLIR